TVRLVRPDTGFEERQLFRRLVACVLAAVERLEESARTRDYLSTLWQFLRVQAQGGPSAAADTEGRLSQRKLGELLGLPRARLPDVYETLGGLFERCRAANSGKPPVTPIPGRFAPDARRRNAP